MNRAVADGLSQNKFDRIWIRRFFDITNFRHCLTPLFTITNRRTHFFLLVFHTYYNQFGVVSFSPSLDLPRERACQTLYREQRGLSALFERPLLLEQADGRSSQEINRVISIKRLRKTQALHWLTPVWLTAMLCRPTGYRRERQCLKLRRQRSGLWNWTRRWPKHASLGRVLATYDWDWTSAEKEYKRTIELNPRYATAHQWYGGYLAVMGRSN